MYLLGIRYFKVFAGYLELMQLKLFSTFFPSYRQTRLLDKSLDYV